MALLFRWLRIIGYLLAFLLVVAVLVPVVPLYRSLPRTSGKILLVGMTKPGSIQRDDRGMTTVSVTGTSRADAARLTGFVHAQERFFQMDLLRRSAAGELAELFGPAAVSFDRARRLHRMRATVERAYQQLPADERGLLEAYAAGVEAGMADLSGLPFEYLLLKTKPAAWRPEDSLLVVAAMAFDLQPSDGRPERSRAAVRAVFDPAVAEFLLSQADDFEAAIDGTTIPAPALPPHAKRLAAGPAQPAALAAGDLGAFRPWSPWGARGDEDIPGSNSFAVAGRRAEGSGALLANDMHLGLNVPNTWYRLQIKYPGLDKKVRMIRGASIPGAPLIVVGSNGAVAWGFTNSAIDTSDVVVLDTDPADPRRYRTPDGWQALDEHEERILVRGAAAEVLRAEWTIWGPMIGRDAQGRSLALRWVMHEPAAYNLGLYGLEEVATARMAMAFAKSAGIPQQNFLAADRDGHIGWTIAGRLPRRVGLDGRTPVSWADGTAKWDGWVPLKDHPQVYDPPSGLLWTANARVVGGPALELLGEGEYATGARAAEIRDQLEAADLVTIDLARRIQLNDRGRYLERWQALLLRTLSPGPVAADPARGELRGLVEQWGGRAVPESAGYRLVRDFRQAVHERIAAAVLAPCRDVYPEFSYRNLAFDRAFHALAEARPSGWLPADQTWDALLLEAADAVIRGAGGAGRLDRHTWGRANTLRMRHPFSRQSKLLAWFLDMPADELPGDSNVVRAQGPSFGASQRIVVIPGREEEGIFQMPGGQSGNPLSSHYSDDHRAWVRGDPAPFDPGRTEDHVLVVPPGAD